ncbi:BMC domain-containing protein [Enterococcus pingfangensis]|uniref:BMC domain-containing protein n=1 Tax=Enterococcus pingfangensis TaxID=2559924 RepID=UPI0010F830A6|nr:BMC domain-containing protein [Enterococcus pingfangensis]
MNHAIGLVEVRGLASAIDVSDTMVKVANVDLLGVEKAKGFGLMTIKVAGDVGAVKAAVDAGKAKALANNVYLSSLVIPRPANDLEKVFFKKEEDVELMSENIEKEQLIEESAEDSKKKSEESILATTSVNEAPVEIQSKKNQSKVQKKAMDKKKKK